MDEKFDAIVVGSGIGGLMTAALLAKYEKHKVLVLEKHYQIGGFTHTFSRHGHEFDTGVHYLGEMQKDSDLRKLLDHLTDQELEWVGLPDEFDALFFQDREWRIVGNRHDYYERLKRQFPEAEDQITKYAKLEKQVAEIYSVWQFAEERSWLAEWMSKKLIQIRYPSLFRSTESVVKSFFGSGELYEIIVARWMGFGVPPDKSSFGMHSLHSLHYSEGAWFPRQGGQSISKALEKVICSHGGRVECRFRVDEIICENDLARGVRGVRQLNKEERTYFAPVVVSNIGSKNTYEKLLSGRFYHELAKAPPGSSMVSLFLGLKADPALHGFEPINYWICPNGSKLGDYKSVLAGHYTAFLSFPSLKRNESKHTAQIIVLIEGDFVERSHPEYESLKRQITERLIDDIERRFGGFSDLIDFTELATPATVQRYVNTVGGSVYGIPTTPSRFFLPWASSRTPLRNLFLSGSDVFSPGISGAIHGGIKAYKICCAARL